MIEEFDGIPAIVQEAVASGMSPVRAFRQAEGRSAHDVAVASGIDLERLTGIENGDEASDTERAALAQTLSVKSAWLCRPKEASAAA
ncbi:XRE family transcriptional regulator [Fulvimarina endophytica]|uniref:XRE family transcriptional regulator n=1 Tax=Fulvimarina endophytica TaxID=2293836 RepID=A0A371WXV3_9HYPH|nr:helix-turn-helix transcriptional regulator [Fulvimarina endophytica]RFC61818.1 XRE family transcriptional regulator [Fulvimarina endophytica]